MKKSILLLMIALFASSVLFAQTKTGIVELLYFKADLACCKARACNALEAEIKGVIEKNYPGKEVVFRQVKLSDQTNKPLVDKYNAHSQSVILVYKNKKKVRYLDISDLVQTYNVNKDLPAFENQLSAKIELVKKSK